MNSKIKMSHLDSSLHGSERTILSNFVNDASVTYFSKGYLNANYYISLDKTILHPPFLGENIGINIRFVT